MAGAAFSCLDPCRRPPSCWACSQRALRDGIGGRLHGRAELLVRESGGGAVLTGPWLVSASVVLPLAHPWLCDGLMAATATWGNCMWRHFRRSAWRPCLAAAGACPGQCMRCRQHRRLGLLRRPVAMGGGGRRGPQAGGSGAKEEPVPASCSSPARWWGRPTGACCARPWASRKMKLVFAAPYRLLRRTGWPRDRTRNICFRVDAVDRQFARIE